MSGLLLGGIVTAALALVWVGVMRLGGVDSLKCEPGAATGCPGCTGAGIRTGSGCDGSRGRSH